MIGNGLAERIVRIQDHGAQVDFRQRIGRNQIEVVPHILMGMVKVGHIDDRYRRRRGGGALPIGS